MPNPIRFVLALHNHQPVGNLDYVFQRAYDDSYRPFLDVLSRYPWLKVSLHISGSLMEWLAAHQPEYIDRLAELVERGQVEILGGAWFEPILPMIPSGTGWARSAATPAGCKTGWGPPSAASGCPNASGSSPSPATWSMPASSTPCWTISTSAAPV